MSPDGSAKSPPPEERLLQLIRGKPRPSSAAVAPQPASTMLMSRATAVGVRWTSHWPVWVGGVLGVILMVEVVVLIVQLIRPLPSIMLPSVSASPPATGSPTVALPEVPSISQEVSRPLFAPSSAEPGQTASSIMAPSTQATDLAARLSLVGIVSGNPPQVIIEDSQTKKTYFVSQGQPVVEGAMVEQVFDTRVILNLQGEKVELAL